MERVVSFEKVLETYNKENPGRFGRAAVGRRWIKKANKELGGWIDMDLPVSEIQEVLLSKHPHGGITLVPKEGLQAKEVVANLKQMGHRYAAECPQCYKRIVELSSKTKQKLGSLYLSKAPIPTIRDHKHLVHKHGQLVHLDGLHRMLSLFYPQATQRATVHCFVASRPELDL